MAASATWRCVVGISRCISWAVNATTRPGSLAPKSSRAALAMPSAGPVSARARTGTMAERYRVPAWMCAPG